MPEQATEAAKTGPTNTILGMFAPRPSANVAAADKDEKPAGEQAERPTENKSLQRNEADEDATCTLEPADASTGERSNTVDAAATPAKRSRQADADQTAPGANTDETSTPAKRGRKKKTAPAAEAPAEKQQENNANKTPAVIVKDTRKIKGQSAGGGASTSAASPRVDTVDTGKVAGQSAGGGATMSASTQVATPSSKAEAGATVSLAQFMKRPRKDGPEATAQLAAASDGSTKERPSNQGNSSQLAKDPTTGKLLQRSVNEKKNKEQERKKAAELLAARAGMFAGGEGDAEDAEDAEEDAGEELWEEASRLEVAETAWACGDEAAASDSVCSPSFDPAAAVVRQKSDRLPFRVVARALEDCGSRAPSNMVRAVANIFRRVLHGGAHVEAELNAVIDVLLAGHGERKVARHAMLEALAAAFGSQKAALQAKLASPDADIASIALAARRKQTSLMPSKGVSVQELAGLLDAVGDAKKPASGAPGGRGPSTQERLTKVFGGSVAEARETLHVVNCLHGKALCPRDFVLRGLAHAFVLSPVSADGKPVQGGGKFESGRARAEAIVALEAAVRRADSQDAGRCAGRLIKALLSGATSEAALCAACVPVGGVQVLPMRVETSKDIATALQRIGTGAVIAEWQLQGERAQVHVQDGGAQFSVFSRDRRQREDRVHDVEKALKGHLKGVQSCIMDVMIVTVRRQRGTKDEQDGDGAQSRMIAPYDLLMLNENVLVNRSLRERRAELRNILEENVLCKMVFGTEIDASALTCETVNAKLDESLCAIYSAKDEDKASSKSVGLVLKRLDGPHSAYFAGQRHWSWQALGKMPVTGPEAERLLYESLSEKEKAHWPSIDEFHFTVVSGYRTRSVEGINDIMKIQKLYKEGGGTPTWYTDNECPDEYRKLGLQVVAAGKLTPARNRALEDAERLGKVCVQTSDDIGLWQFFNDSERYKGDDEANAAYKRCQKLNVSPVAASRYLLARMRARGGNCRLGGAYCLHNGGRAMGAHEVHTCHFVMGDFFVADRTKCRFDERLTLKEDYDFTASNLEEYGEVLRCNRLIIYAKHETNAGGACGERDAAGLKEQYNIGILKEKWPGMISDHPTRANQIVLRWKPPAKRKRASEEASG